MTVTRRCCTATTNDAHDADCKVGQRDDALLPDLERFFTKYMLVGKHEQEFVPLLERLRDAVYGRTR